MAAAASTLNNFQFENEKCHLSQNRGPKPVHGLWDTLTSVLSLPLLYFETLRRERHVRSWNLPPCCHFTLPYIMGLGIEVIRRSIQITHLHTSRCHHGHYCNGVFVLFYDVTCYTHSLFSCTRVNIAFLLNITRALVATCMVLGRLEYV